MLLAPLLPLFSQCLLLLPLLTTTAMASPTPAEEYPALRLLPPAKTRKVSGGNTYSYVYKKAKSSKPTFLLLHGFPNSMLDWSVPISDLIEAGYGVLAPDMLGYGGTSKPTAIEEYKYSKMSAQMAEILDKEGLTKVVGVGHDWGAAFLGKFVNFYPKYFTSLVFMSTPYRPGLMDLDAINAQTEATFGYPNFGYMKFLNETGSEKILDANIEAFLALVFPSDPELWRTSICPIGATESYLLSPPSPLPALPSWEIPSTRRTRISTFRTNGFTGPTNWYKAAIRNIDAAAIAAIPAENLVLKVPVLFVGGNRDYAARIEVMQNTAQAGGAAGWFKGGIKVEVVEGGSHWFGLESPRRVSEILKGVVGG